MILAAFALASAAAEPTAFSLEREGKIFSYEYGWPKEAAAIPSLHQRLLRQMNADRTQLEKSATAAHAESRKGGSWFPDGGYQSAFAWETKGQSARLLSLGGTIWGFTGGAHGHAGTAAILWDRRLDREVGIDQLTQPGTSWARAIRQPFCTLLDRERAERRGGPVRRNELFGDCPALKQLTLAIDDSDRDGRFDHVEVTADQYVAGSWAEGPYTITLPITARMIARLKPEYRPSFEPQAPVQ